MWWTQSEPSGWAWALLCAAFLAGLAIQAARPLASTAAGLSPVDVPASDVDVEVFAREGCPACAQARTYLDDLQRERPDLRVRVWDVLADPAALERLHSVATARGQGAVATPTFFVRGQLVVGWDGRETTGRYLEGLLA